jgi:hypothetical protein
MNNRWRKLFDKPDFFRQLRVTEGILQSKTPSEL